MDLNSLGQFVKEYLFDHWTFFTMSVLIGMIVRFGKNMLWTKERALNNSFFQFMRITMPFHGAIIGLFFGISFWAIWKQHAPAGPTIVGPGKLVLYYMGSGLFSAWVVSALQHIAAKRGIDLPQELQGTGDTIPAPAPNTDEGEG